MNVYEDFMNVKTEAQLKKIRMDDPHIKQMQGFWA